MDSSRSDLRILLSQFSIGYFEILISIVVTMLVAGMVFWISISGQPLQDGTVVNFGGYLSELFGDSISTGFGNIAIMFAWGCFGVLLYMIVLVINSLIHGSKASSAFISQYHHPDGFNTSQYFASIAFHFVFLALAILSFLAAGITVATIGLRFALNSILDLLETTEFNQIATAVASYGLLLLLTHTFVSLWRIVKLLE